MNIFTTTHMTDKVSNCEKSEAELLLLGAKSVTWDNYPNLKYVFRAGVGCDNIDIRDIKKRNLRLFFPSNPTRNIISESVAHLAFGWIMAEGAMDRDIREWYREPRVRTLKKHVGIIGMGRIGSLVYKLCGNVGLKAVCSDPKYNELYAFNCFDIITFHVPLETYEAGLLYRNNHHFINKTFLDGLKSTITLINTSRGKIADEQAIADFLTKNPKARYITDVYEEEPYTEDCPLSPFHMKQFFGSPHIASYTHDVREALTADVNTLIKVLKNEAFIS